MKFITNKILVILLAIMTISLSVTLLIMKKSEMSNEQLAEVNSSVLHLYYAEDQIHTPVLFFHQMINDFEEQNEAFIFMKGYSKALENPVLAEHQEQDFMIRNERYFNTELSYDINLTVKTLRNLILSLNYTINVEGKIIDKNTWMEFTDKVNLLIEDVYFNQDELTLYKVASAPKEMSSEYSDEEISEYLETVRDRIAQIEGIITK